MSVSLCPSLSQSLWRTSLASDNYLLSSKVMCRSLALNNRWASQLFSPRLLLEEHGCVAMLSMNRTAGLTVKMKCEFAKGESGLCLWVLTPGMQPLTQLDQHHIPGHQAQSLESNWRCTKNDMIHLGYYISKNMGFLSISLMEEPQRFSSGNMSLKWYSWWSEDLLSNKDSKGSFSSMLLLTQSFAL